MKRLTLALFLLGAILGTIPVLADNISIDESQQIWSIAPQVVSGELFLCEGPAVSFSKGPCMTPGPSGVSDIIIFNNDKHQVSLLSNNADGTGLPADLNFDGGGIDVVNPRWLAEPNSDVLIWTPGPLDPGFSATGITWTITSHDAAVVPEPSSALTVLLMIALVAWCRRRATRGSQPSGL